MEKINWRVRIFLSGMGVLFILLASCTKKSSHEVKIDDMVEVPVLNEDIKAVVPHIFIYTYAEQEVTDKEVYLNATIKIEGNNKFKDLETVKTKIKGRGNSTWAKPKKPYRLKLDKKRLFSICQKQRIGFCWLIITIIP
ncbi:hypothetical protein OKW96_05615 [Sphingobacterium sp. KU25419]|nr:hypothetical protein OKW96_05615 [Sphingobacterium sp. KU25419]